MSTGVRWAPKLDEISQIRRVDEATSATNTTSSFEIDSAASDQSHSNCLSLVIHAAGGVSACLVASSIRATRAYDKHRCSRLRNPRRCANSGEARVRRQEGRHAWSRSR